MWTDAFGDKVKATITPIEQGQYIGLALTGAFQASAWRNHGGSIPISSRLWWQSASAAAARVAWRSTSGASWTRTWTTQLDIIKTNPDPAARKAAAEAVNKIFGEKAYNLWLTWALWGDHHAAATSTASRPTCCPTGRRASASPSPAATRSTRCGATTGSVGEGEGVTER